MVLAYRLATCEQQQAPIRIASVRQQLQLAQQQVQVSNLCRSPQVVSLALICAGSRGHCYGHQWWHPSLPSRDPPARVLGPHQVNTLALDSPMSLQGSVLVLGDILQLTATCSEANHLASIETCPAACSFTPAWLWLQQ